MLPKIDVVEYNLPGVVLSVAAGDQPIQHVCAGLADVEKHVPMQANTLFQIGKITRFLTASLILKLVESHALTLDMPLAHLARQHNLDDGRLMLMIRQYPYLKPITLRELLNTTSGLPAYEKTERYLEMLFSKPKKVWQVEGYLDLITGQNLNYRADYQPIGRGSFGDSATNYIIAGLVVEAATGQRFSHAMRDFFFEVGLNDSFYSGYGVLDHLLLPKLARGYLPLSHPHAQAFQTLPVLRYNHNRELCVFDVTEEYNSNGLSGSAALSTTADLITALRALLRGNIVQTAVRDLFEGVSPHSTRKSRQDRELYGLGLYKTCSKQYGEIIWNAGNSYGYSVLLAHSIQKDITLCLAVNMSQQSFTVRSYGLVSDVLKSLLS